MSRGRARSRAGPAWLAEVAGATLVTLALLGVFVRPWLREAAHVIPDPAAAGNPAWGADARLIAWILRWDLHALATQPWRFFDANIFHPARRMLTGSEHFLSSALLSALASPWSDNPALGANLAVLATYVLAAVSMYALLRLLGMAWPAAAVGAAALALGPLRVPAEVHVLQYPNYPLVLVLLTTARRGGWGSTAFLTAAVLIGVFSSYYLAAMVVALLAVEMFLAGLTGGARPATRIALAALPAFAALAAFSYPYVQREVGSLSPTWAREVAASLAQQSFFDPAHPYLGSGWAVAVLAWIGVIGPWRAGRRPAARWWRWLALVVVGWTLAWGPYLEIGPMRLPLPYAWLSDTPLRVVRNHARFVVLAQIGVAGLAAEGAAVVLALGGRRLLRVAMGTAILALVVVPRGLRLDDLPRSVLPHGGATDDVLRSLESGPLLEVSSATAGAQGMLAQSQVMLRSTLHWLPLLNGHTGYPPWWWKVVAAEISRLPHPDALQSLVDLTGLRWILVRKAEVTEQEMRGWKRLRRDHRAVLRRVRAGPGDLLLEVAAQPRRRWFEALARSSPLPSRTTLDTPLVPLPDAEIAGKLSCPVWLPVANAGLRYPLGVQVKNASRYDWPALLPASAPDTYLVVVEATWRDAADRAVGEPQRRHLRRDVIPGAAMLSSVSFDVPQVPGAYELELRLRQVGGADFSRIDAVRLPVKVERKVSTRDTQVGKREPPRAVEKVLPGLWAQESAGEDRGSLGATRDAGGARRRAE